MKIQDGRTMSRGAAGRGRGVYWERSLYGFCASVFASVLFLTFSFFPLKID